MEEFFLGDLAVADETVALAQDDNAVNVRTTPERPRAKTRRTRLCAPRFFVARRVRAMSSAWAIGAPPPSRARLTSQAFLYGLGSQRAERAGRQTAVVR